MHPRKTLVSWVLAVCSLGLLRFSESQVPQEEVYALQQIVSLIYMGATYWRFDADLCEVEMVGISPAALSGSEGYVECNCNYNNNTVCHITKMSSTHSLDILGTHAYGYWKATCIDDNVGIQPIPEAKDLKLIFSAEK